MTAQRLFIGLYSGSAADGVEAALVAISGRGERMKARVAHYVHHAFDEQLRHEIHLVTRQAAHAKTPGADSLAALDTEIAATFAQAANELILDSSVNPAKVVAIGSSGQVITTSAAREDWPGSAMELGSPTLVARQTGRPVVADFMRGSLSRELSTGKPFNWPNWILFRHRRLSRVIVHLGGIAHIAFVPADAAATDVIAFDAGPGTLVIDALAHDLFGWNFDTDGSVAARGSVCAPMLNELLANTYFQKKPPKICSPSDWGHVYVERFLRMAEKHRCARSEIMMATAAELTASTIAAAIGGLTERPHEVILSGGGARNIHLANRIRTLMSPSSTISTQKMGIDVRAKQALCAAMLAAARVDKKPATAEGMLGGLYLP